MFYEAGSEEVGSVERLEEVFTQRLQEYAGRFASTQGEKGRGGGRRRG